MKRLKKSVALVTTAALLAGSAGSLGTGLTVSYAAEPNLLVDMDFENLQADQEIPGIMQRHPAHTQLGKVMR